jgi:hypothetical protein
MAVRPAGEHDDVLARLGDSGAGEQAREGGGASRLGEDANLVPDPMLRFADRVVRDQDDALDVVGTTANAISPARLVPSESAAYPL